MKNLSFSISLKIDELKALMHLLNALRPNLMQWAKNDPNAGHAGIRLLRKLEKATENPYLFDYQIM